MLFLTEAKTVVHSLSQLSSITNTIQHSNSLFNSRVTEDRKWSWKTTLWHFLVQETCELKLQPTPLQPGCSYSMCVWVCFPIGLTLSSSGWHWGTLLSGLSSLTMVMKSVSGRSSSLVLHRDNGWDCRETETIKDSYVKQANVSEICKRIDHNV